ncbi:MAG: hypothetical protein EXS76_04325 [Nitrosarchaeum sp.]|nr:hypothetical protein [Nitrosarchaeum sp.]
MSLTFENFDAKKSKKKKIGKVDFDTIVCPAHDWGIQDVFLKEKRWYAVTMQKKNINKIKFLALYEIRWKSIRYVAKIKRIEPFENTRKFQIIIEGEPIKIKSIRRSKNYPHLAPQNKVYTKFEYFKNATFLEDIFLRRD